MDYKQHRPTPQFCVLSEVTNFTKGRPVAVDFHSAKSVEGSVPDDFSYIALIIF